MKEFDGENILKLRMRETTDRLLMAEPGTIDQTLLFLEFYLFERFRIVNLLNEIEEPEDDFGRWHFLRSKLREIEHKIEEEKAEITFYEEVTNESLTEHNEECKIFKIEDYKKGGHNV